MTQTEALKLALEALEVAEHFVEEYAASKYYFAHVAAITAIKEALRSSPNGEAQPAVALEQEPKCNPHPKAPHGFDRNASHANDRYVCECEGWSAYDAGYEAGVIAGIEASMEQESEQKPVACDCTNPWAHDQCTEAKGCKIKKKLLRTPPQHSAVARSSSATPRKPLTDAQREEIAKGWRGRNWTVGDIIDAIEAAHGIKEKNT